MLIPKIVFWLLDLIVYGFMGWTVEGEPPKAPKYVAIGGPHTSNWDFLIGMATYHHLDFKFRWYGKHTIFRWPFRGTLQAMGGFPIERSQSHDVVSLAVDKIKREEEFVLAIAPEGTRSPVERWKTGFYHIALGAKIPICPFALDFERKKVVCGDLYYPTGDQEKDFKVLQDFFRQYKGRHPQKAYPPPEVPGSENGSR